MNKITLPPLPEPSNYPSAIEMLRARDLEVARVVLEAAKRVIDPTRYANEEGRSIAWDHYHAICALEASHAE